MIFCFERATFWGGLYIARFQVEHFKKISRGAKKTANASSHPPSARELVPTLKGFLNSPLSSGTHKLYQRASGTFTAFTPQFFSFG